MGSYFPTMDPIQYTPEKTCKSRPLHPNLGPQSPLLYKYTYSNQEEWAENQAAARDAYLYSISPAPRWQRVQIEGRTKGSLWFGRLRSILNGSSL